jgi:CelD/BcsL family acetyltransferase involved in cellulose biosynthesis
MSDGTLITDIGELEALAPEWDALAVAASNPVAAPSWVLPWWRHVAEPGFAARVVAVRDRGRLVGLAPFYAHSPRRGIVEYRLMGSEFGMCMQPLALPGREWQVAREIGSQLAEANPAPSIVAFGPMTLASHWIVALRSQWPGRAPGVDRLQRIDGAPLIVLNEPSYEAWLESLGSKMRRDVRRAERLFEEAGGATRMSTLDTYAADAEAFVRLHGSRWDGRGWSRFTSLGEKLSDWFGELGAELIEQDRLRMYVLEVDGKAICVKFCLRAGDEFATVNVGWDEDYAKLAPAKLSVLRVVEDGYRLGCRRVHMGTGDHANKLRLANGSDPVGWTIFIPPSSGAPLAYAHVLPSLARKHAREVAEHALAPERLQSLKKLRDRF